VTLCGGEGVTSGRDRILLDRTAVHWNRYGPTEGTASSTCERVRRHVPSTIGPPICKTKAYILNPHLLPVQVIVAGELRIGGAGCAREYFNRPALPAEQFRPNLSASGDRIYRTADPAHFLPDGRIEFLGRLDSQIKVRGLRIEPGEVEAAKVAHPDVRQGLFVPWKDAHSKPFWVASVVAQHSGNVPTAVVLRAPPNTRLPTYRVPSAFIAMDGLPHTPNGNMDHETLPRSESRVGNCGSRRSKLAMLLTELLANVLKRDWVVAPDNCFELAAHSRSAQQLLSDVTTELASQVPLASFFFEGVSVAGIAGRIEGRDEKDPGRRPLISVPSERSASTILFVYPGDSAMVTHTHFARVMRAEQPLMTPLPEQVSLRFDLSPTVSDLAEPMMEAIRPAQPERPNALAGFSLGGWSAYEFAGQLKKSSAYVPLLSTLDFGTPDSSRRLLTRRSARGFKGRPMEPRRTRIMRRAVGLALRGLRAPAAGLHWRPSLRKEDLSRRGALQLEARYRFHGHDIPRDPAVSSEASHTFGSRTLGRGAIQRLRSTAHLSPGGHLAPVTETHVRLKDGIRPALCAADDCREHYSPLCRSACRGAQTSLSPEASPLLFSWLSGEDCAPSVPYRSATDRIRFFSRLARLQYPQAVHTSLPPCDARFRSLPSGRPKLSWLCVSGVQFCTSAAVEIGVFHIAAAA